MVGLNNGTSIVLRKDVSCSDAGTVPEKCYLPQDVYDTALSTTVGLGATLVMGGVLTLVGPTQLFGSRQRSLADTPIISQSSALQGANP
jgi:hypothetical protein